MFYTVVGLCQGIRVPESGNFCLWNPESNTFLLCNLESWTLESGIPLKESEIPLTIKIQNPSSADKESGIQYLESGIHGVESRIQNCLAFPPQGKCCVRSDLVTVSFFNRNFIEEGLTFLASSLVGIVRGKKFYIVLLY